MKREEQIMNDPNLSAYTDKQRGWINEAFMDGVRWADDNRPVDWQQVRTQAAIAAMNGILANQSSVVVRDEVVIRESVSLADTLVKELKGE